MRRAALLLVLMLAPFVARAEDRVVTRHYPVSALTAAGLEEEMQARGPKGFWAYTTWHVDWTPGCQVSLTVSYTFPEHLRPEAMPRALRLRWQAMLVALKQHEQGHAALGAKARRAVQAARCRNTGPIFARIAAEEREYDAKTRHGARDGVTLR
jgi:predicted secreted Zn-dependent protease